MATLILVDESLALETIDGRFESGCEVGLGWDNLVLSTSEYVTDAEVGELPFNGCDASDIIEIFGFGEEDREVEISGSVTGNADEESARVDVAEFASGTGALVASLEGAAFVLVFGDPVLRLQMIRCS